MAAIPVTSTSPGRAVKPTSGTMQTVQGSTGTHSFLKEEQVAFAEHINHVLSNDTFLTSKGYLPIQVDSQDGLYAAVSDGILLCKMINLAHPDTVDERALNLPTQRGDLNPWELTENVNMAINSARAIGCSIVNVHAKDITHAIETHREYLVLGVVWQVVRAQLLAAVNLKEHPELVALLGEGEDLKTFMKLPAEEVLIRWINYHLGREGIDRRVSNLGGDVKDGVPYLHLLHSIDGSKVNVQSAMAQDPNGRAAAAIAACRALNVPTFVTPNDITSGNKRLNLAFTAQLFNSCPGLTIKEEEKQAIFEAAGMLEDSEDARETRVFRFWLNSMNLSDPNSGATYYIHDLFDELGDGLILLHAIDRVAPGAVDWKKVNTDRSKLNKYKRIENCNYCVTAGKELGFSLPGIGGVDIENGNTKLVLGYLWQLMRMSLLRMLQSIGGPGGVPPKDSDILEWANKTAGESGRNEHAISSFKDPSLSTSLFLLDVLAAVEPRAINPELVTPGSSEDEKSKNAKYVISVARKLGCVVFLTHEDITDVKPKMILTLLASMMHRAKEMAAGITTPAGVPGGQGIGTSAGSALDSARSRTGSAGDQQQQVSSARSSDAACAGVGVAAVGASTSARGAGGISSGGGLGKGMGTTTTATATTTTTGTTIVGGHSWPPQKTGGSPPGPQQMPSKAQFGGAQPGQPGGTGGSPGQVPSGGGAPMLSKSAAGSSAAQRYLAGIGGPGAGAQQGEK